MHGRDEKCTEYFLVGKHEGKRLLGKPNHRWEANIKIDLKELGWEGVNMIHLKVVADSCGHYKEPSGSGIKQGIS
jgi:hypothetical protein